MDWQHRLDSLFAFISMIANKFVNWIDLDFWECFFIFLCVMFVRLFAAMSRDEANAVDAQDLVIDSDTGKVSIKKLGALVALATSTWWTAKMAGSGTLTIEFAGLYMLAWTGVYVGMPVTNAWAAKMNAEAQAAIPQPTPGTTQTTTSVVAANTTQVKE